MESNLQIRAFLETSRAAHSLCKTRHGDFRRRDAVSTNDPRVSTGQCRQIHRFAREGVPLQLTNIERRERSERVSRVLSPKSVQSDRE